MSVTHPTVGFTNILRPIHELQRNKLRVMDFISWLIMNRY